MNLVCDTQPVTTDVTFEGSLDHCPIFLCHSTDFHGQESNAVTSYSLRYNRYHNSPQGWGVWSTNLYL